MIWIPSDLHVTDPRQQKFIAELRASSEIQSAVDLRIEKLEDMKTAIHKKLNPPPAPAINANDAPVHVYLVYDSDDRDEVESLENYLFDLGYEVIPSLAGQTWTQEYHDNNLKLCDALLFYHGQGHDSWLAGMRTEFLRARGLRQGKPFYAKAVYLSSLENDFKQQRHETIVGPIAVGGAEIMPRLVNRLLNDMGDNPDQLPVLQHALMRTWDEWKEKKHQHEGGAKIDLCCYEAIGGMAEALSRHVDQAYSEL